MPITALKGSEVQGDRFRRLDEAGELGKFTCLHFATHGANIESDTPMESYLFLQDEKIRWNGDCELATSSQSGRSQRLLFWSKTHFRQMDGRVARR